MKLSNLINYRNQLNALSATSVLETANVELDKVLHLVDTEPELMSLVTHDLDQQYATIQQAFINFETDLNNLKTQLQVKIEEAERPWIQEGYNMYDKGEVDYVDTILTTRKDNSVDSTPFRAKLNQYANWKYPAMIIRPGLETFIEDMVAYDPLYIVDLSYDFLRPAMDRFNKQYQNRLRPYVVKEDLDAGILNKLPNEQFGICLAYNYFNFRPLEIIKKYLEEIYQKLKPGGIFVFTFNDCDRRSAVELVENHYCCYTPGHIIRELISTVGYEITYSWNDDGPSTWIEIRKPGELDSLKGGQTLARILPK